MLTETPETQQIVPQFELSAGLWAMDPGRLYAMSQFAPRLTVSVDLPQAREQRELRSSPAAVEASLTIQDNIAIIGLAGVLQKNEPQYSFWASTSTVLARRKIRMAVDHAKVEGILLVIESSGGPLPGMKELVDDVAAAAKRKPVWAYGEDLCSSGAYWVASQAEKIFTNALASVGGIGTFAVVTDSSKKAEKAGVVVHVVRAGQFKGAGTPGTKITDEHLAQMQGQVNTINAIVLADIASGRKFTADQMQAVADGRHFIGKAAQARGLIDGVRTFDQVFAEFVAVARQRRTASATSAAADASPLTSPNASHEPGRLSAPSLVPSSGVVAMSTEQAAERSRQAELSRQIEKNAAELAALKVVADWNGKVSDLQKTRGLNKAQATRELVKSDPALHAKYLESFNAIHGPPRRTA